MRTRGRMPLPGVMVPEGSTSPRIVAAGGTALAPSPSSLASGHQIRRRWEEAGVGGNMRVCGVLPVWCGEGDGPRAVCCLYGGGGGWYACLCQCMKGGGEVSRDIGPAVAIVLLPVTAWIVSGRWSIPDRIRQSTP